MRKSTDVAIFSDLKKTLENTKNNILRLNILRKDSLIIEKVLFKDFSNYLGFRFMMEESFDRFPRLTPLQEKKISKSR